MIRSLAAAAAAAVAACALAASPGCKSGSSGPSSGSSGSTGAAPGAAAGVATCFETLQCYSNCTDGDAACHAACDAKAARGVPVLGRAVLDCLGRSGCADEECGVKACAVEFQACTAGAAAGGGAVAAAAEPAAPDPAAAALVGSFAKSAADFYMSGGVHTGSAVKQYTFAADGTYVFHAEAYGGGLNQSYAIIDERGAYAVAGNQLTITPASAGGLVRDRDGNLTSRFDVALEPVTYAWTFHLFEGLNETDLVLSPPSQTQRDGAFASNGLFPASYLYTAGYHPEWKFP